MTKTTKATRVFRDPAVESTDSFRVMFEGRMCSPDFNSRGAAAAYVDMLRQGQRKPEYAA